jgi:transposase
LPVHRTKKNAEAVATFRQTFADLVAAVLPAEPERPVEVWAFDESRLGLQPIRRRRITARGTKPIGTCQHRFDNFYLYGAIAPRTGDGYFLGLPKLNAAQFQVFLDEFARARPATLNVLLIDNSRSHTAQELQVPANVVLLFQPPYALELNPAERVWEALKQDLAWQCFANLPALQATVAALIRAYEPETLRSLTAYPYIMDAINALSR